MQWIDRLAYIDYEALRLSPWMNESISSLNRKLWRSSSAELLNLRVAQEGRMTDKYGNAYLIWAMSEYSVAHIYYSQDLFKLLSSNVFTFWENNNLTWGYYWVRRNTRSGKIRRRTLHDDTLTLSQRGGHCDHKALHYSQTYTTTSFKTRMKGLYPFLTKLLVSEPCNLRTVYCWFSRTRRGRWYAASCGWLTRL
jgi:hypothetical protein